MEIEYTFLKFPVFGRHGSLAVVHSPRGSPMNVLLEEGLAGGPGVCPGVPVLTSGFHCSVLPPACPGLSSSPPLAPSTCCSALDTIPRLNLLKAMSQINLSSFPQVSGIRYFVPALRKELTQRRSSSSPEHLHLNPSVLPFRTYPTGILRAKWGWLLL